MQPFTFLRVIFWQLWSLLHCVSLVLKDHTGATKFDTNLPIAFYVADKISLTFSHMLLHNSLQVAKEEHKLSNVTPSILGEILRGNFSAIDTITFFPSVDADLAGKKLHISYIYQISEVCISFSAFLILDYGI